ncbi:MAG: PEGA domain-containing protein [Candidatus Sericytochromatia bacterium]|nr:PEGA domain-containing protein [Candidatus Sericytochromatia bacterium]
MLALLTVPPRVRVVTLPCLALHLSTMLGRTHGDGLSNAASVSQDRPGAGLLRHGLRAVLVVFCAAWPAVAAPVPSPSPVASPGVADPGLLLSPKSPASDGHATPSDARAVPSFPGKPPLSSAAVAVWAMGSSDAPSQQAARSADPGVLETLRQSGAFTAVDPAGAPGERSADQVMEIGSKTGAVLLVTGGVVASGDRATVTVTVQDTVTGNVLGVASASGTVANGPALARQLTGELVKRWQDGQLIPSVIEWGDGPGEVRIDSVPRGAIVTMDGKPLGTTPVLVRGVGLGVHTIDAILRETVTVDTIDLVTSPPGLQVKIDDKEPAYAPVTLNKQHEGSHRVVLLGTLAPRQLGIHVQTTPTGAVVRWDGQQIGETPLTTTVQPKLGEHDLMISGRPQMGTTASVTVIGPERHEAVLTLDAFAKIIVTSVQPEAAVTLNDLPVGKTPMSVAVKAGRYTVGVGKNTYMPQTFPLTLEAGAVADVRADLAEAKQGNGAVLMMPTGEVVSGLALTPLILGFGRTALGSGVSLVGLTAAYGWPNLVTIGKLPLGLGIGAGVLRADGDSTSVWGGGGVKVQVLQQGAEWPVSAAVGAWGQGPEAPNWQGYVAISRQVGDFTMHFSLATGGLGINADYHRWPHWIVGGVAYLDYGMLQRVGAGTVPLFGLRGGYAF